MLIELLHLNEGSRGTVMRIAVSLAFAFAGMVSSGCSLCPPSYMNDYAGVGGKWQRSDPEHGRVGSVFSDPASVVSTSHAVPVIRRAGNSAEEILYDDSTEVGESIMEFSRESQGGVIILGDDWGAE
jgi:hypothetical protein